MSEGGSVTCVTCGRNLRWSIDNRPPPYDFGRRCDTNTFCHMIPGKTWDDFGFDEEPVEEEER